MNNTDTAEETDSESSKEQFLTFRLDQECYAIDILAVREIRSWTEPTPLPHTPTHVLGAMNLRGAIIPVVDLRVQFSVNNEGFSSTTGVIVVQANEEQEGRQIGLVVDQVLDVAYLEAETSDDTTQRTSGRYVRGLRSSEQGLVILVELANIVEDCLLDQAANTE
ncbi:MAG: chemotaxis protein CheW [Pseudomonadales bacterium]